MPIIRRRSPTRWPTSGRCCATSRRAVSCRPEIVGLEIGVGSGARAAAWLDRFKSLDEQCGTNFYSRLHFILGDYSPTSLERAVAAVAHHGNHVSGVPLDALNPYKALTAHRFKIMYVHLTNVYDNLPFDDLVRRDGKLYLVEVRAYLNGRAGGSIDRGLRRDQRDGSAGDGEEAPRRGTLRRLRQARRASISGAALWDTFKLEERLRVLDDREEDHVPPGLSRSHLEDLLAEAPDDVRFHISRGAGESFANTLPLLHPRGYPAGAGHLRQRDGRLSQRVPGPRQAGWLARDLGERRAACAPSAREPGTTCTSRRSRIGPAPRPAFSTPLNVTNVNSQLPTLNSQSARMPWELVPGSWRLTG